MKNVLSFVGDIKLAVGCHGRSVSGYSIYRMTLIGSAVLCIVVLSLLMLPDSQGAENSDGTRLTSVILPSTDVCGKRGGRFKGIGGSDSEPVAGTFPWIAALGYKTSGYPGTEWLCIGSLVTDRHIVAAGHCVGTNVENGGYELSVARLGVLDLNATGTIRTEADYEVDTSMAHPGFSSTKILNDIGIIKLKKKVTFSRFIQPICLPTLNEFKTKNFTGTTGYIAGWRHSDRARRIAVHFEQVTIGEWHQERCKKVYEEHKKGVIDNKVICGVSGDGTDICQGDAGGPLMMPYGPDSSYYLYAVTSYEPNCGDPFSPGVYTRVSEYKDWILSNLT